MGTADRYVLLGEVEWPVSSVQGVVVRQLPPLLTSIVKTGSPVAVRLAGEQDKRTHLGVYLGDLSRGHTSVFDVQENKFFVVLTSNPAMWVPALGRVVWGDESWWGEVESPEQLKQITDEDIANVWYVRALREQFEAKTDPTGA